MGVPESAISPLRSPSGASSRLSRRISVLLPLPVAPMSTAKSPASTRKLTPRSVGSAAPG